MTKLIRRLGFYLLTLLPALGLAIQRLQNQEFNSDEFQHTYLAWASFNYDQLPYRDLWDNHGPVYSFINSCFMQVANLQAGVDTILAERYLNVFFLILGFLVLYELFRLLTGKSYYAVLGFWFFASTNFITYSIQVRPDNVQCLFLYSGLLLLIKAIKENKTKLTFYSGICFVLMMLSNLKSIASLSGIILALLFLVFFDRTIDYKKLLLSLFQGLFAAILASLAIFYYFGMLENYLIYSFWYNKLLVQHDVEAVMQTVKAYYFKNHILFFNLVIQGLVYWVYKTFSNDTPPQNKSNMDAGKLIIVFAVLAPVSVRLVYKSLWLQYDLLFIPILSCIVSWFVMSLLERLYFFFSRVQSNLMKIILASIVYILFLFMSWQGIAIKEHPKKKYLARVDRKMKYVLENLAEDEHVEYFAWPLCLGRGFARQASPLIQKHPFSMSAFEKIYGENTFGQDYIHLLNQKKVKFIIGTTTLLSFFKDTKVRRFIIDHYRYKHCLWTRDTSYEELSPN